MIIEKSINENQEIFNYIQENNEQSLLDELHEEVKLTLNLLVSTCKPDPVENAINDVPLVPVPAPAKISPVGCSLTFISISFNLLV